MFNIFPGISRPIHKSVRLNCLINYKPKRTLLNIIGGELRGAKLITPKGKDFRPTLNKTREALFSVISSRYNLKEYECYDLFAGSGALGFEAVSRGAVNVRFIEYNRNNYLLLKRNIEQLGLESRCQAVFGEAIQWLTKKKWEPAQRLFFIDPPYESKLAQTAINVLAKVGKNLENNLVVIETPKDLPLQFPEMITLFQQKIYGPTKLDFLEIITRSSL
jgi:16S rRNA (guanine966-N2)-methyltransferase